MAVNLSFKTILYILIGIVIRILIAPYLQHLKHYPHFQTPLTDTKQLLEAFNNHKLTGKYFLDQS
jgi:hypothetical protein